MARARGRRGASGGRRGADRRRQRRSVGGEATGLLHHRPVRPEPPDVRQVQAGREPLRGRPLLYLYEDQGRTAGERLPISRTARPRWSRLGRADDGVRQLRPTSRGATWCSRRSSCPILHEALLYLTSGATLGEAYRIGDEIAVKGGERGGEAYPRRARRAACGSSRRPWARGRATGWRRRGAGRLLPQGRRRDPARCSRSTLTRASPT